MPRPRTRVFCSRRCCLGQQAAGYRFTPVTGIEQSSDIFIVTRVAPAAKNGVYLVEQDGGRGLSNFPKQVGRADVDRVDRTGNEQVRYLERPGLTAFRFADRKARRGVLSQLSMR